MVPRKVELVCAVLFAISCLSLVRQFAEVSSPRTVATTRRTAVDESSAATIYNATNTGSSNADTKEHISLVEQEQLATSEEKVQPSQKNTVAPAANSEASTNDEETSNSIEQEVHIKVNYPVFVASLYKSGTTTIHAYFECGGQKSVHYSSGRTRTGPCLQRRIQKGLHPVFEGCGGDTFDIYTDNANLNAPRSCFDPSVHGLDQIYESYPNGTILMAVRDSNKWLDSVERYKFPKWELLPHLQQCPDLWPTQQAEVGNRTLTKDDILHFYDWHTEHVRKFAADHPSMTYIEVKLEDTNTAQILEDKIGIPSSCWGHSNINKRHTSTTATGKEAKRS